MSREVSQGSPVLREAPRLAARHVMNFLRRKPPSGARWGPQQEIEVTDELLEQATQAGQPSLVGHVLVGGIEAAQLAAGWIPGQAWGQQPWDRQATGRPSQTDLGALVVDVLLDCRCSETPDGLYPTSAPNLRGSWAGGWYTPFRGQGAAPGT